MWYGVQNMSIYDIDIKVQPLDALALTDDLVLESNLALPRP